MAVPGTLHIRFETHSVELRADSAAVLDAARQTFAALLDGGPVPGEAVRRVEVRSSGAGHRIEATPPFDASLGLLATCRSERALARQLKHYVIQSFVAACPEHLWIHAAAVTRDDQTVLLVGPWGSGKSTIATTLCERGWRVLADDVAVLSLPDLRARAFPLEPSVRQSAQPVVRNVSALPRARITLSEEMWAEEGPTPVAIVFPSYDPSGPSRALRVRDGEAALVLLSNVLNFGDHEDVAVGRLSTLLTDATRFALRYRSPEQGADKLEAILRGDAEIDSELHVLSRRPVSEHRPVERPATPWDGVKRRLTVGMATYDDFDGAYFSIQALRLANSVAASDLEIIVLDNHPEGPEAAPLAELANWIPGYRYVPNDELQGTASRDLVFREATSEWVLCLDSHVLMVPGALDRLLEYVEAEPDCMDLLQGPLIYDDLKAYSTHFKPKWSAGMFGAWATDDRGGDPENAPFEIPMQGLGVFACRRDAWLGFNPRFNGFGGEEGYIHEKFRQAGRQTRCLPFLRWLHRFARPGGAAYRNVWPDRIRNYAIGLEELDLPADEMEAHFEDLLGVGPSSEILASVHAEMGAPLHYFDVLYVCHSAGPEEWARTRAGFDAVRLADRVRKFKVAPHTEPAMSRLLAHRSVVARAKQLGLQTALLIEEGESLPDDAEARLAASVAELKERPWSVFHLGYRVDPELTGLGRGCAHLRDPNTAVIDVNVVAYHADFFDEFLAAVPVEEEEALRWLEEHLSLERFLCTVEGRYVAEHNVLAEASLLREDRVG